MLTLSSKNYNETIDVLKDRFGNEQILISAHMESLLKIDKIRSVTNIKGLRMHYTHVENCIRNLIELKLDTARYGSLLTPILKDRLPDEINVIISRQFCGQNWSLDKVMQYFGNELEAQETCSLDKVTSDFSRKREPYTTSDYLLIAETKDTPVYIVVEIISLQGVIRLQIVRLGKLFYVSMEGVLSAWTMGTSQKSVRLNMCAKDLRRVNIIFRYVRLIP